MKVYRYIQLSDQINQTIRVHNDKNILKYKRIQEIEQELNELMEEIE